ncbi:ATP-binding protein [Celeribacter sp.]|uniref:ATP-binding protein n=1 Tax=Celeribacter sp. TaxID=1890673 RepID=UPI003A8FC9E7
MRPRSIRAQLGLLIFLAFVVAQGLAVWLFTDERGAAIRAAQQGETADRAVALSEALTDTSAETRDAILSASSSPAVRFAYGPDPLIGDSGLEIASLKGHLPENARSEELALSRHGDQRAEPPAPFSWLRQRMLRAGIAPSEMHLSLPLSDGGWLNVSARFQRPDLQLPPVLVGTALLSLLLILGTLWIGLRSITGPLRRLAEAAEGFGLDRDPPEMPEGGPLEVQALSDALARMHERLSRMIADRTQMLAALGHDLRSPITALRLRAEMVDDDETRERMATTLDEMQDMVEATLAYARGVSTDQPTEPVDLSTMLHQIAADLSESGPVLSVEAAPITLPLRNVAMRRAFRNLLGNAQRYGYGARVELSVGDGHVQVDIDDNGPGIPDEDLERVFDPFVRLEDSRSLDTGGTGLGLPIARSILRAHGGDVVLMNRPKGGLRARVTLPYSSEL